MASYYTRDRSPYYWIRCRKPDGKWGAKSSGIRIDSQGSHRKITLMVAQETSKEENESSDGASAMFNRWVPQWIEYKYRHALTRARVLAAWGPISEFFKDRRIIHPSEVTYSLCHEYLQARTEAFRAGRKSKKPVSRNTAILELQTLGAFMQEALRRGWINSNPCYKLGFGKRTFSQKRAITKDEERLILDRFESKKVKQWMSECFLVAMRQGCRLSEVRVPMSQIDTDEMVVTFNVKGGRMHTAPLHKDLLPLVMLARKENRSVLVPLPVGASGRWGEFFDSIGLDDICFHCTRVTVVTRLCEAGFSESQTMAYVGHSSVLVHAIYRKMRPAAVAKLGDALSL